MTRTHARAARGQRARGTVPWGRWERLTVTGALALDGLAASMGIVAATSMAVPLAFAERVLVPALRGRPGAVVVMDNLAARKAEALRDALDRAGPGHRHLPPCPPDLNPIESRLGPSSRRGCGPGAPARAKRWKPARPGARRDHGARCTSPVPTRRPHLRKLTRMPR